MMRRVDCSVSQKVVRAIALIAAIAPACAATPVHPIPLAIFVDGAPPARLPDVAGLALHTLTLPPSPPVEPDHTAGPLSRARTAYAAGDFDTCRAELARIDVPMTLAAGQRDAAARALAFDAACAWGGQAVTVARAIAAQLAAYGLALPDAAIAPDIEAVLGEAIVAAGNAHARPIRVRGEPGARLRVDGQPPACALPCTIDLVPGDHILAVSADGFADAHQQVRVPAPAELVLAQPVAPPALAAAQWRARAGRGQLTTDAIGARLIARLGERRVAVLAGEPTGKRTGALIIDGAIAATATASDDANLVRELAYDADLLHRPTVWQRPWFWIAVSGIALGVAAGVTALTYQPTRHTALQL